jgi:hypothetical protein
MPTTYTVTLDDTEQKAMEYISTDVDFWIQNAVHERARIAIDEMVADDIRTTLQSGGSVSGTKEDIVMNSTLPDANARNEIAMQTMVPPPVVTQ